MVNEKIAMGLPLLRIPKLSKIALDEKEEIKKLYEANNWWNN